MVQKSVFQIIPKLLGGKKMTVQIALMNTNGIALATDSALTIQGKKVFHSSNKLFELCVNQPIGIMTYGSASLLNVPWETFIKMYRNKSSGCEFDTLQQYVEDFLKFLSENQYPDFMSPSNDERFTEQAIDENLYKVYKGLADIYGDLNSKYGELHLQNEIQDLYDQHGEKYLSNEIRQLEKRPFFNGFNEEDVDYLKEVYGEFIEELIYKEFRSHLINDEWINTIKSIVIESTLKRLSKKCSGVVIAGFGTKEIYPSVCTFIINGRINGKIKYRIIPSRTQSINNSLLGTIMPFAQTDMVDNFLTGIHVKLNRFLKNTLKKEFDALPGKLTEDLADQIENKTLLEKIEQQLGTRLKDIQSSYREEMAKYQREEFVDPILDIVQSLPTNELAHMAESMLNISSLERKMSTSLETVGGPIDVAVITKGDGFQWVKKK